MLLKNKRITLIYKFIVSICITLFLMGCFQLPFTGEVNITVTNTSWNIITEFYVKPITFNDWDTNILEKSLLPGESLVFTVTQDIYDFKVKYDDFTVLYLSDIDLSSLYSYKITLTA